ncbi:MAG: VOC family protein [Paracoccaceae bacterium]|nr:VOC family protein [Paracoccaceae bacterium]
MLTQIKGLHHVTSLASGAQENNAFFTRILGLRRVKKTVNFDAPEVYHLYYGDGAGTPGSVMTYFPFPHAKRGKHGTGEVGQTAFSVPKGSLSGWAERFETSGIGGLKHEEKFGQNTLLFGGPDGDEFALVEANDARTPWISNGVGDEHAIRGFHSARMRLQDIAAEKELLEFMGYRVFDKQGATTRMIVEDGNGADYVDLEAAPLSGHSSQGAGSVHHIAFAVEDRARQLEVRKALMDTGYQVTPVIDRDYFFSVYFRSPGGVLFEIATNEPGFDRDEDTAHLGETLKLPKQHAHLRQALEQYLEPITD